MRISDWSSDVCSSDLQTRGEPRPVPDARRFAIAIALREDDVVDACRIDLRALDQRLQDDGAEFAGAHRRQAAAELADGGADRGDDGGAAQGHFGSPVTIGNGLNRTPGLDPGSRRSEEGRVGEKV